ncbi:MAG: stage III sporulation protein AA [Clostridia bacterium]|nr:stage III sporulation protein AA [Clostridia bacterium]
MMRADWLNALLELLPDKVSEAIARVGDGENLLEIRLRRNLPIQLVYPDGDRLIYGNGGRGMLGEEDSERLLLRICENSIYAWTDELKNGFVTLQGGIRVGICGRAVQDDGHMERFSEVSSFNFRVVREIRGCASGLLPRLTDAEGGLLSTLIISPPGAGKTTLLRDLVRLISHGSGTAPQRVSLIDERFELAGCVRGIPQFDVGPRTDVMSGMRKAQAMRRMTATMNPQLIATDELQFPSDIEAVLTAKSCGISILATAHGADIADIKKRKPMERLLKEKVFLRVVRLKGTGRIAGITDENGREVEVCTDT